MKKLLWLLLLLPSLSMSQYIRGTQDTTALPTTNLWEGRFIRVNSLFYEYQRGGWYQGKVDTMYHRDSLRAARLINPRTINGVAFDGSQNITITAAAVVDTSAGKIGTQTMDALRVLRSDSTTMPGYSTLTNLATKFAKSDTVNFKGGLLKNADSTTVRNYDNFLYVAKATSGTAAFTTTARRKSVYVAGSTTASIFTVTAVSATDVVPVAGDLLSINAKTDSLVVLRPASGTSALSFNRLRVK